jgi:hypothetical protein
MAALNFLSQVGSEGNGVGLSSVVVKLCIQDERYFSQILSIKLVVGRTDWTGRGPSPRGEGVGGRGDVVVVEGVDRLDSERRAARR